MLQRNEENIAPVFGVRGGGIPHEHDRDALLDAKDETIVELRAQVSLLRDELESKNAMLLRLTESIGELSARVSEAADGTRTATFRGTMHADDTASDDCYEVREKPERTKLPEGYRLVAVASDAWVLVAPGGSRVAGYRGGLDLRRAALDAREHHQSSQ